MLNQNVSEKPKAPKNAGIWRQPLPHSPWRLQDEARVPAVTLAPVPTCFSSFTDNGQAVSASPEPRAQKTKEHHRFSQGLSLSICYSASIGGIATLTGTTPNLVLQGQVNS